MSFRIQAYDYKVKKDYSGNGDICHQIYSNNDFPKKLREYLIAKGVELDEDSCFLDYEIKNIQEFLEVMFEIHKEQTDDSYWDLKPTLREINTVYDLISHCEYKIDCAIIFIIYNFVQVFDDFIERYWDDGSKGIKYKLKKGKHIYLSGF